MRFIPFSAQTCLNIIHWPIKVMFTLGYCYVCDHIPKLMSKYRRGVVLYKIEYCASESQLKNQNECAWMLVIL